MYLNTLRPAEGAKKCKTRVGRGIGCGLGKTSGRGHKGQRARAGGYHKIGFEGGQMPLQRRLPKFGFVSRKSAITAQVNLKDLMYVNDACISLQSLKHAGIITKNIRFVKIIDSGQITKAVSVLGVNVTKGACKAILAAGGRIEE